MGAEGPRFLGFRRDSQRTIFSLRGHDVLAGRPADWFLASSILTGMIIGGFACNSKTSEQDSSSSSTTNALTLSFNQSPTSIPQPTETLTPTATSTLHPTASLTPTENPTATLTTPLAPTEIPVSPTTTPTRTPKPTSLPTPTTTEPAPSPTQMSLPTEQPTIEPTKTETIYSFPSTPPKPLIYRDVFGKDVNRDIFLKDLPWFSKEIASTSRYHSVQGQLLNWTLGNNRLILTIDTDKGVGGEREIIISPQEGQPFNIMVDRSQSTPIPWYSVNSSSEALAAMEFYFYRGDPIRAYVLLGGSPGFVGYAAVVTAR